MLDSIISREHTKSPGAGPTRICLLVLIILLGQSLCVGATSTEFFVLWGDSGQWTGRLAISDGRFTQVTPYLFTDEEDRIVRNDSREITWRSVTSGDVDGLQIIADGLPQSSVCFSSNRTTQTFALKDLPETGFKVIHLDHERSYLIIGRGSPAKGPRAKHDFPLPAFPAVPPRESIVALGDMADGGRSFQIRLAEPAPGELAIRRRTANDGRLYLEIYSPSGALHGPASISTHGSESKTAPIGGSLWASLEPFIGTVSVELAGGDTTGTQRLTVPASLVEVRGSRLFLNGEPFLIKGTLPRDLNDSDAAYIKTLGVNTLRGFDLQSAERHGFMLVASLNTGLGRFVSLRESPTTESFEQNVDQYVQAAGRRATEAARSPHTLAIQLGNEQIDGNDPWSDSQKAVSGFERLDFLLARAFSAIKPLDPMLPLGYANHARGYIAPDFLDVYMHNSYMDKDRYGVPLRTFMQWQGCDKRPFISTEFGANRYTPQAYHGAGNSPVLEKIHAWNFPHRWKEYMDAGTAGAISYCMYDLDTPRDQGTSNFGLLTFAREPKLACWEVGHMWRDFEVQPAERAQSGGASTATLSISYKREYWARNCKLRITGGGAEKTVDLADFAPGTSRGIEVPSLPESFHWEMNYTTHRGLTTRATGAYPRSLEEKDFLDLLKGRDTFPFLSQLLDAEVVTVEGRTAPPTLTDMQRTDAVIPIAFRKPNGTVYVTAFARLPVRDELYVRADIRTAFTGKLTRVDEWTGDPIDRPVDAGNREGGILIRNVDVPRIPGPIGQRSDKPLSLPVFRITPDNNRATSETRAAKP